MGKDIFIIAGPNGAGKTTFAESFLPREGGCLTFLNADIRRRHERGMRNFQTRYKFIIDRWMLYDASGKSPQLLEEGP